MAAVAMALILIAVIVLLFWMVLKNRDRRVLMLGEKIPGPKRMPIIGNILHLPRTGYEGLQVRRKFIAEFGHLQRFWIGYELLIMISDPVDAQVIFNSNSLLEKAWTYNFLKPWIGTGLLTSSGEKWHSRRKVITPTFHFKILEQFIDVFNRNGDILVEQIQKEAEIGGVFDIQPYISRFALDVICETAMGVEVHAQTQLSPYVNAVRRICKLIFTRINSPWQWSDLFWFTSGNSKRLNNNLNVLHSFTNKVISNKKLAADSQNEYDLEDTDSSLGLKKKTAFLELLISLSRKEGNSIKTDEDIREEVDTFMFEGHDTTTSAICCTLYLLGKHQEVQDKAFEEVYRLIEEKGGMSKISYQDIQGLKYLECVIKESLRIFPSVPAIGRHLSEDIKLPSGYVLPKGATAIISLYYLHRNEDHFPNPEVFNPDNFLPEASAKRHPFSYCPFSAGPRNCIGQKFAMMELKCTLVKLIHQFKFLDAGSEWDVLPNPTLVLQSLNGYKIKLQKREGC